MVVKQVKGLKPYYHADTRKEANKFNKSSNNWKCKLFGHNWQHKYKSPIKCLKCNKYWCFY